jgi:hypothetical protein
MRWFGIPDADFYSFNEQKKLRNIMYANPSIFSSRPPALEDGKTPKIIPRANGLVKFLAGCIDTP